MSLPQERNVEQLNYRHLLLQQVVDTARVIDRERGYIECLPLNNRVEPQLLRNWSEATQIYINQNGLQPTAIVGVPDRGKEASTALSLQLGIPSLVTHRVPEDSICSDLPNAEYDLKTKMIIVRHVISHSRGMPYTYYIRGWNEEDTHLLLADDFCAEGKSARQFNKALREFGINRVTHAFIAAKHLEGLKPPQTGLRDLLQEGIHAFSGVIVIGMKDNGRIEATVDDSVLT